MNATTQTHPAQEERLAEILEEYLAQLQAGRAPTKAELLARHPDLAEDLETCLASLEYVGTTSAAIDPPTAAARAAKGTGGAARVLGDFRIVREIGRGGMGVVYEAEQISLGRRVALKILPFAGVLDQRRRQRFTTEAQAAALLHHQNIVPVYQVGCERGVHYYAMQYVDGRTLAEVIRGMREAKGERTGVRGQETELREPLSEQLPALSESLTPCSKSQIDTQAVAAISTTPSTESRQFFQAVGRLGIQAAEALEHAHQAGIIHRDVKPGNLLVEADGKLWITDFGLARIEAEQNLTVSGDLLGTIRYMSPEQALAKRVPVDHRTDIYSLGATLYELLTLEPLVAGDDRAEILHKIAFQEPRPPRRINRRVPAELETIVLKAISKSPTERYATVQEMADDLRRFLDDQPIKARRPTVLQRVRKWARRHRQVVTACAVLITLTLITVGPLLAWREHQRAVDAAAAQAELKKQAYDGHIARAYEAYKDNNIPYVQELLALCVPGNDETDYRGFEYRMLEYFCREAAGTEPLTPDHLITSMAISPGGRYLAACGADLYVPIGSMVTVWDLSTKAVYHRLDANALCVAFSADGKRLLTGHSTDTIRQWDVSTGEELEPIELPDSGESDLRIQSIACSKDGLVAATGSFYSVLLAGRDDSLSGLLVDPIERKRSHAVIFSPDGQMLIAACWDGKLRRWRTETQEFVDALVHADASLDVHVTAVAVSPSGDLLASGGTDGRVVIWDAKSSESLRTLASESGRITAVTFIDEEQVAFAKDDKTVTVWDWKSEQDGDDEETPKKGLRIRRGHGASVTSLVFVPNRSLLISGGKDKLIRLWDSGRSEELSQVQVETLDWGMPFLAFPPNSSSLYVADKFNVQSWTLPGLVRKDTFATSAWSVIHAAGDADLIATTHYFNQPEPYVVQIWNTAMHELVSALPGQQIAFDFSPDGTLLLTGGGELNLWNISNPHKPRRLGPLGDYGAKSGGRFFPRSNKIALGGVSRRKIGIWDAETRTLNGELKLEYHPRCTAISPDEKLLAVGTVGATIELFDVASRRRIKTLKGHGDTVYALDFSPDGKTLASGSLDRTVKLWRVATTSVLLTLDDHDEEVASVRFSPDGQYLVTGSRDGVIRVRRATMP